MPLSHTTSGSPEPVQLPNSQLPDQNPASESPTRRLSTQGELIGQQLRSGTPHLHHFLQASPASTATALKLNGLSIAGLNARRYSSADIVLHGVKSSASTDMTGEGATEGGKTSDYEGTTRIHGQTCSQSLLSPAQTQSALFVYTASQLTGPTSSTPTIQESPCEDAETVEQDTAVDLGLQAPVYFEDNSLCTGKGSVPVSPMTAPANVKSLWDGDARRSDVPSPTECVSSSASPVSSNPPSDTSSDETADTEATSPERCPDGDETPIARVAVDIDATFKRASGEPPRGRRRVRTTTRSDHADRYGTPEMPRGTAKLPHLPASGLTQRKPSQSHPKHLPRAEKLPMSGYELLASNISSSSAPAPSRLSALVGSQRPDSRRNSVASFVTSTSSARSGPEEAESGPGADRYANLKPIYRRFEALNHRMLLHLQDELSELEEQLHRLDTTDTQTRRMQSRILPASRRAEHQTGGELQWHKSDILGKIGFKLGQYNHVLSTFAATRDLPEPSVSDVNEYRSYLATHQPITEVETRFLDTVDDLITLAAPKGPTASSSSSSSSCTANEPSVSANGRVPPAEAQERLDVFSVQEDTVPPFPTVTPIPGTMHGNSWLTRHNRLPSMSERGHSRAQSQPTASPRFVSRHLSMSGHQQQRRMSNIFPFRPPASPLQKKVDVVPPRPAPTKEASSTVAAKHSEPSPVQGPAKSIVSSADAHVALHVTIAMAVAILIPILAFSAVPGFVGRITVVLLVGLSATGSVVQSGVIKKSVDSNADMMCVAAVYAAVMAVVAGVIS